MPPLVLFLRLRFCREITSGVGCSAKAISIFQHLREASDTERRQGQLYRLTRMEVSRSADGFGRGCLCATHSLLAILGLGGLALVIFGIFIAKGDDERTFLMIGGSVLFSLSFGCIAVVWCIVFAFANPDESVDRDEANEHPLLPPTILPGQK
jgi:hypothetical protein